VLNERDPENPRAGGAEVHLFEILRRLAARGFPVTVLCAGFRGSAPRTRMDGVDVRRIGNRYTYYLRGPLLFRRLARGVAGPAVLVETLNKLPFYGPLYSPVPELAIVHHLFGATAFRQVGFPIALATYLSELGIPRVYRRVPLLAISPSTRDDLVARGLSEENILMVPSGLDHEQYTPDGGEPGPVVLALGRLEHYKRLDLAVAAMPRVLAAVPAARFVIAGRGGAVPALARQVARLGLGHAVELAGFVSEEAKIALYRSARVFVNPSEKEGWGLTVVEANACGVPVVASDSPGLRDAVLHERTGLLVPHGDVEALASAIVRLLQDRAAWGRLRAGGLEWARTFSWDGVTDHVERMIAGVLARPGGVAGA
jgi:glycosyltransferase involved in cell wall biosynthesis